MPFCASITSESSIAARILFAEGDPKCKYSWPLLGEGPAAAVVSQIRYLPRPHVAIRTTPCVCFRPWPSLVWREQRPRARYAR